MQAVPQARALLRLHRALATFDAGDARAVAACRTAALRYLEALAPEGVGPGEALRRLRAAATGWGPAGLSADARLHLDARLRFWVGSAFGLRWRDGRGAR